MDLTPIAVARPSRLAIALLCGLVGIAASATAEAGPLTVRLMQLSGGTAVTGTQTFITAALIVSGSLASPLTTSAFGANLSWTASGTGVTNSDLYTVTPSGIPFVGGATMDVNSTGFLYSNGLASPVASMNTTNLNSTFQRYVAVDADPSYYPTLSGSFSDITIATLNFAVSDGIRYAEFDFALNGDAPSRGFFNSDFNAVSFDNGGGKLVVVPEPDLAAGLCAVGLIVTGSRACWLRRRHLASVPASRMA